MMKLLNSLCLVGMIFFGSILSTDKNLLNEITEQDEDITLFDQLYDDTEGEQEDETHDQVESEQENQVVTQAQNVIDYTANPYIGKRIARVRVVGNRYIESSGILIYVPYKVGMIYKPTPFIKQLYHGIKKLHFIKVMVEPVENDMIEIIIQIEEKPQVKQIALAGNKALQTKDILKEVDIESIGSIDAQDAQLLALKIKQLYKQKGYFFANIKPEFVFDDEDHVTVTFHIAEHKKTAIKKIGFKGNESFSDKTLRSILLTKEEWLLSFLDKTGAYHEERAKYGDTQVLEQFYQNNGFFHAKVTQVEPIIDEKTESMDLLFTIQEGQKFTFDSISANSSQEFDQAHILALIGIEKGQIYSRQAVMNAVKLIESLFAHQGYIFTHVDPVIIPNEKEQTVSVHFTIEQGKKMVLNRLTIRGNKKTYDSVIRRKLLLQEGEYITQKLLQQSKQNVQALGYFDPKDGVQWRIKRLDDQTVDIDLMVKEVKTGHFGLNIGYGGNRTDSSSPLSGFTVKLDFANTNWGGSGVQVNASGSWAHEEQTLAFHIAQPWLFDKPVLGALDIYHKRPTYDELRNLETGAVHEKITGGALTTGYIAHSETGLFYDTQLLASVGVDSVSYEKRPKARLFGATDLEKMQTTTYQSILDSAFTKGEYMWWSFNVEQDMRNHPMFAREGHRWKLVSKIAVPTFEKAIGFFKVSFDTHWYTTLIEDYDLILHLHGFFGAVNRIDNKAIPFAELFHIGGPATVRGFRFGEIGPKFMNDTGIGAKKAVFVNAELLFPITADYSMRGVVFYDGGSGWDNPYVDDPDKAFIKGNKFDYRHSVGVGIRLTSPMPVRIDWGFKLDPRKDRNDRSRDETASEVHFGMSYDW
ncbi:outer membrane protein assembly factor BamA [bacterium]|nr:MAG: outer membrane protein assembly factor BamA [bacterium]QQR61401.1 MAG: outer membrane protein assembly factor BamA [bacterium]QQR63077.1 MAG: outer membrane protein assembly factor BamA [bacterium]